MNCEWKVIIVAFTNLLALTKWYKLVRAEEDVKKLERRVKSEDKKFFKNPDKLNSNEDKED